MPKSATTLTAPLQKRLATLGLALRTRRKELQLSAVVVAEAAGVSRVTLHRIERGHPSVAMGAYFATAAALGADLVVRGQESHQNDIDTPHRSGERNWRDIDEEALLDSPQTRLVNSAVNPS